MLNIQCSTFNVYFPNRAPASFKHCLDNVDAWLWLSEPTPVKTVVFHRDDTGIGSDALNP